MGLLGGHKAPQASKSSKEEVKTARLQELRAKQTEKNQQKFGEAASRITQKYGLEEGSINTDILPVVKEMTLTQSMVEETRGLMMAAMPLRTDEIVKTGYLSLLANQNWLLIKQNEKIISALEKLMQ